MKNKKTLIGLIVGLVCLALCLALVLTMCNSNDPVNPNETTDTTDTTGATTDTASPTEQTTAPTEETTAPTEETQPAGSGNPGGSGGFNPGGSSTPEETVPEETRPAVEVDKPGTETNAYYETVNKLPGSFTTVKIPAKGSVCYLLQTQGQFLTIADKDAVVVLGEKTYKSQNGVVTVPLAGLEFPVALKITNSAANEKAFAVTVLGAIGSESNPEVLKSVEQITAKLEKGNKEGHFYTWTAEQTGLLLWGFDKVQPQTVVAQLAVTVGDETAVIGSADQDLLWTYVTEGDQLTVRVATVADESGNYPAAEIAVSSLFVPCEEVDVTELPATVQTQVIPAGGMAYYALTGVSNTVITIQDPNAFVICNEVAYEPDESGTVRIPVAEDDAHLIIGNLGTAQSAFTMEIAIPVQTDLPEVMIGEKNTASFGENDPDAAFVWTAFQDGTLKLMMDWDNYSGWYMQVINQTTGETVGEINSDGFENYIALDVKTDDILKILVNTHEYDSENTPAGEVSFYASFVSGSGTQEDPYSVIGTDFDIPVAAGQTVYCTGRFSGMTAEILGENITVENDGKTAVSEWGYASLPITGGDFYTPPVFTLTNAGEDTTVNVVMSYPMGSINNPQELTVGEKNTAFLEAKDEDGYSFRFVAYADGTLKIAMDLENLTEWMFCVENPNQSYFGDWHYSDSDPYVTLETLEVKAGDEITVKVNTYNSLDMWDTPEGEVSFYATFISGTGTEEDPYNIQGLDAQITVPAGQTVYCTGRFSGMIVEVFGENVTVENDGKTAVSEWGYTSLPITGGDMFTPPVFTLTNTAEEEATYDILFTYPLGSSENPADLLIGEENAVSIEAENETGYYYQFEAYADGELTISMSADNETGWFFAVENITQSYFGDWHYSDSDPLITSETISVMAGDIIRIQVDTYNPADMWTHLAGDVIFDVTFVSGSGTQEDPYNILGLNVDIAVPAGQTVYCTGRFSGMIAEVFGENVTVENDGKSAVSEWGYASLPITGGDFYTPPVFTLTNTGEDAIYNVVMTYPIGSSENPADLLIGEKNTASIEAGNATGYYYQFEAYNDGKLTISMSADNETGWFFAVENPNQSYFSDWHYSDDDPLVTTETISVTAGDIILVQIDTYNPADMWEHLAGDVSFTATFLSGSGTQDDPYQLQGLEADIAVEAGQTVYYTGRYSGMILNLTGDNATVSCNGKSAVSENGVAQCPISGGDMWTPPVFTVTNSGETATYHISFAYPLGTMDNPDTLAVGQNSVTFEAGSMEYYFLWKAPKDGTLTITIDDTNTSGWQYCVDNLTAYQYGDSRSSGDPTVVNSQTLTVSEGDEIQFRLCTFDPSNPWEIPAGEVSYTVTFE